MTIIRLILVKYFPVKNFYANLFYLIVISLLNILWPCLIYHGRVRHILVHFFGMLSVLVTRTLAVQTMLCFCLIMSHFTELPKEQHGSIIKVMGHQLENPDLITTEIHGSRWWL